jgi:hypothetical protein
MFNKILKSYKKLKRALIIVLYYMNQLLFSFLYNYCSAECWNTIHMMIQKSIIIEILEKFVLDGRDAEKQK